MLFVHGLGSAGSAEFIEIAPHPALAGRGTLIVDLPGFGRSEKPADFSYSLADQAAVLWRLADGLGLATLDLVGHSMGGNVALAVQRQRPERVRRLVLAEANLVPGPGAISGPMTAGSEEEVVRSWDAFLARFPLDVARLAWRRYNETLRQTTPVAMHRSAMSLLEMAAEPGLLESFARLPCRPGWVVSEEAGTDGGIVPRLEALGVPVERVPRSGHGMMADNPEGFVAAVARLLG